MLALQIVRHLDEQRERLARQSDLLVEVGELRSDVAIPDGELRDMRRDDLANVLVDGDSLVGEATVRIELPDRLERVDRLGVVPLLRLQLTDLVERPGIARVGVDDLPELEDRLVVLLLLDEFLRRFEHFFAIDGHDPSRLSKGGSASDHLRIRVRRVGAIR